jgi:hypothetical protein
MFYTSSLTISLDLYFWQVVKEVFFQGAGKMDWMGENDLLCDLKMMNLIMLVVFCNCTIAIGCFILTLWTIRLRQQLAAIANCCDRWTNDCVSRSIIVPEAILNSRAQIRHLREIYQQQVVTIDSADRRFRQGIWAMGLFIQLARSLPLKLTTTDRPKLG